MLNAAASLWGRHVHRRRRVNSDTNRLSCGLYDLHLSRIIIIGNS
ncbi:unnamed protein product [Brassica oleracea var. botrytis]